MSTVACPECGHNEVRVSLACHTWPGGTRSDGSTQWMACQGCDSALNYWCSCWLNDEVVNPDDPDGMLIYQEPECKCMWDYTHGLNKHNPRYQSEQEFKPDWLPADLEFTDGFPVIHSGVELT